MKTRHDYVTVLSNQQRQNQFHWHWQNVLLVHSYQYMLGFSQHAGIFDQKHLSILCKLM